MPCYHMIPARRPLKDGGPWRINPPLGEEDSHLPCGKCIGCRTDRANNWATRAIHEARLWQHNRFVTLTYDDEHLPPELIPAHLQKFLKRLRKRASYDERFLTQRPASIRFLGCGEYGTRTERPHYHLCLFNLSLSDERRYDDRQNVSDTLSDVWGQGNATLSEFLPARAGYVAGYSTKIKHRIYCDADGVELQQPFLRASSRPALGRTWLEQFHADAERGYLIIDGTKRRLPRYYVDWMRKTKNLNYEWNTEQHRPSREDDNPLRKLAAELIHKKRLDQTKRDGI